MKIKSIAIWSLACFLASATVFICVDCACGTSMRYDCTVSGRERVEAWTSTTTTYDNDGSFHINTAHHPAEYHLYCTPVEDDQVFDVSTSAQDYGTITNGQAVSVVTRKGRFTGARYLPRIEL
jgi:hypothetical protein